jgi:hypothetical protein
VHLDYKTILITCRGHEANATLAMRNSDRRLCWMGSSLKNARCMFLYSFLEYETALRGLMVRIYSSFCTFID